MSDKVTNEYLLKICAIGSGAVGKTSLIRRFAEGKFTRNYLPTLGVDITTKKIQIDKSHQPQVRDIPFLPRLRPGSIVLTRR